MIGYDDYILIDSLHVDTVKALAAREAVRITKFLSLSKVCFEGDALNIVLTIGRSFPDLSKIGNVIESIRV